MKGIRRAMGSWTPAHIVAFVLFLLAPVLIIGGSLFGLLHYERDSASNTARELRNVARVMNGKRLRRGVVQAMEAHLSTKPKVLVLGNSTANTDINPRWIAQELGIRPNQVVMLTVPNSVGTHWYAILKNRVYANDHNVPLVIVAAPLVSMLLVQPYSEASYLNLTVQLSDHEPLLESRVNISNLTWGTIRENRGDLREDALAAIRDASIGLFFRARNQRRETEAAMERLFADDNLIQSQRGGSLPVVDMRDANTNLGLSDVPPVEESFFPELVQLATENNTKLVFVRTPMAPATPPSEQLDLNVPPETRRELANFLEDAGHTFIDMGELNFSDSLFQNLTHMNEEGSDVLTLALSAALQEFGALGRPGYRGFHRPPTPTLEIDNEVEDRQAPDLDGRWVFPGETVRYSFDEGWGHPPEYFSVRIVAEQFGAGTPPMLRVDGRDVRLNSVRTSETRARYHATQRRRPPTAPWTIEFRVPPTGGRVLIQGLRVGVGAGGLQLEGDRAALFPASYDLFGNVELSDGLFSLSELQTTYLRDPPRIRREDRPVWAGNRPEVGRFLTEDLGFLSDNSTIGRTPFAVRCSPVQVVEDDLVLPRRHETCTQVAKRPRGRVCHAAGRVGFGSSDGSSVTSNGSTYRLALDPERRCYGARWLYPRDRMVAPIPPEVVQMFRESAQSLTVTAFSADGSEGTLVFKLKVGKSVILNRSMTLSGQDPKTVTFQLDHPLRPYARDVTIEVANTGGGFFMVTSGILAEGASPSPSSAANPR